MELRLRLNPFKPFTCLIEWCYSKRLTGSSFTVSGSQITFVTSSGTLTTSDSIDFIMALGNVLDVGTPTDGSISTNKIANSGYDINGAKIAPTMD